MHHRFRRSLVIILLLLLPLSSQALDRTQPIQLEADEVELNEQAGTSTYRGNVRLTQGKLSLQAESIVVYLVNSQITRLLAQGNPVELEDELEDASRVEARANSMDYDIASEEILMTGNGTLNQNGNILNNDRIRYNLLTGVLNAGGTDSQERVKVILQPSDANP